MSTAATDRLAGTFALAPVHSSAEFSVPYLVTSFRAGFGEVRADLADGKLSGAVDVGSVDVRDESFRAHLMSPEFFDAEAHPEIAFASSSVELDGDEARVQGDLTIKGVTRPLDATGTVSGPTEDFMGNTRLGLTFETTIDRTDFGVSWNADLPSGGKALSNEVTLTVVLEFSRSE